MSPSNSLPAPDARPAVHAPRPRLDRPIFVVGSPRSGTTLVQCIISASSRAFSLPETHFFRPVLPTLGQSPTEPLTADQVDLARSIFERFGLELDAALWGELRLQAAAGRVTVLDVFVWLVDQHRPAADVDRSLRVVEKTPMHVLHLEQIGALFPDALFVNVVRDPVDVVSSWLDAPFATSRAVLGYARHWVEAVLAAERYAAAAPGRVLTIQYEVLVRQPERCVRELCQFLDLPYETRMLAEFGQEASRNVTREERWKDDVRRGVLLDRHGVWRQRITPGQAWLSGRATAPVASRYGYRPPSASAASISAALIHEARERYREARQLGGRVGAVRHALAAFKVVRPAGTTG